MDRPCLPAIHFLLLPGVDAANFWGDLLRQFSLDEHKSGRYAANILLDGISSVKNNSTFQYHTLPDREISAASFILELMLCNYF